MDSLENQLAQIYKSADEASRVLRRAGLNPADVDLTGRPKVFWFRVLDEAWKQGKVHEIVECAAAEYPLLHDELEQEVAPFIERLKEGGEPIDLPPWRRISRRTAVSVVSIGLLLSLGLFTFPRPEPTAQLWKEVGKLEQSSVDLTGALNSLALQGRSELQSKAQEINQLRETTRRLEDSVARLRERQGPGGLTAEQQTRLERAEAAIRNSQALLEYSNGRLSEALAAANSAVALYKQLAASQGSDEIKGLLGRSLINRGALQAASGLKADATASLDEARKTLPVQPENQDLLAKAERAVAEPQPASQPEPVPAPIVTRVEAVSYEPEPISGIVVEPLEGPEGIRELWLPKPGESQGRSLEAPGSTTAVASGCYDLWCRTTGAGQFKLVSGLEVRAGQLTRVRPAALVGRIVVEPIAKPGLSDVSEITVIKAGILDKGSYYLPLQSARKLGVPLPIVAGKYDLLYKPANGSPFVVDKGVEVEIGGETRVRLGEKLAAFAVPKAKLGGVGFKEILVLQAGTRRIAQRASAADQPMIVAAGQPYDIILSQSSGELALKQAVTPKGGELTYVP